MLEPIEKEVTNMKEKANISASKTGAFFLGCFLM
jgi:hypothetical protein